MVPQVKALVRRWLRRPSVSGRHFTSRDMVSAILQLQATPTAELVLNPGSLADQQLVRFTKYQITNTPHSCFYDGPYLPLPQNSLLPQVVTLSPRTHSIPRVDRLFPLKLTPPDRTLPWRLGEKSEF